MMFFAWFVYAILVVFWTSEGVASGKAWWSIVGAATFLVACLECAKVAADWDSKRVERRITKSRAKRNANETTRKQA